MTYLFKIEDVPLIMKLDRDTFEALNEMGCFSKQDYHLIAGLLDIAGNEKSKPKISNPCPGCGADLDSSMNLSMSPYNGRYWLCQGCGGLIGYPSAAEAYDIVKGEMEEDDYKEKTYYDIRYMEVDTKEEKRRHGWYNPENGKIVQTG